ncbi:hypothetical protein Brutus_00073 [Acinetobacter phage Brutus]|nr:hypothetical protein Brutus_00073 [Acinetobacter phage Brutus]
MESYKIRVNNEAESKEAQELFFELGYSWPSTGKNVQSQFFFLIACGDGDLNWNTRSQFGTDDSKELTLPQLRDLVVLKRNDVSDANYRSKSVLDGFYFKSSDGVFYFMFEGKWVRSTTNTDEGLEPIAKDFGLISGAVALANVHKCIVQYLHDDEPYGRWTTITDHFWSQYHLGMFLDPDTKFKFRFKPQTIKFELELPKPFDPKVGEIYWYLTTSNSKGYDWNQFQSVMGDEFYCQFGAWRTEAEAKQVVEQLRKIKGAV